MIAVTRAHATQNNNLEILLRPIFAPFIPRVHSTQYKQDSLKIVANVSPNIRWPKICVEQLRRLIPGRNLQKNSSQIEVRDVLRRKHHTPHKMCTQGA